ncbi:hypothetical protein ACFL4L_07485 [bacterium]
MPSFHFSATINKTYRAALEKLFYFNPGQSRYFDRIVETVETFGQPKIAEMNGMLTLDVESLPDSSTVFVCHGNHLVGVVIYFKETETMLNVLHFAVDSTFSLKGSQGSLMLMPVMMEEMIRIAQRESNITHIKISYTQRLVKV